MTELSILNFVERAFVMTNAHWFILILMTGCACWILSGMMDSTVAASMALPVLVIGGALGQHAMTVFGFSMSSDKFVNSCYGMTWGVLAAGVLFLLLMITSTAIRARL